jgi:hypothetical protein
VVVFGVTTWRAGFAVKHEFIHEDTGNDRVTLHNFLFSPNEKLFGSFLLAEIPFCRLKFHLLGCLLVVYANQKLTFLKVLWSSRRSDVSGDELGGVLAEVKTSSDHWRFTTVSKVRPPLVSLRLIKLPLFAWRIELGLGTLYGTT